MRHFFLLLFGILIFTPIISSAQISSTSYSSALQTKAEQWQVTDIKFKGKPSKDMNPFDVVFGAVYSGPEGQSMRVPGFFNGNNEWVSRFSSGTEGTWTFETYSSLAELSGKKGTIQINANTRLNQKGAVIIDPQNPQAFIYEDGSDHFLLAYELDWLFALDYENPTSLPRTTQILDDIQENGFNHIVMNAYAHDVNWTIADNVPDEYFFGKPDYGPFEGGNNNPDYSKLNIKLFQHLDKVFVEMQKRGLDAHLMIYVWNKQVNWPDMYSKADNLYFDYIIERYQAFNNVIWDVSKEALDYGRCDIPYINERISRIRNKDAYKRLITVHDYEYNSREPHRVDFISIQSWRPNLYALMLQGRSFHKDKPVVNIEHGGYEEGPFISFLGNYTNPETCLKRTYECVFAGVYGSYYWQDASWNIVVWDAFDDKHDFDPPRYDYYKHLAGLFVKYNFNTMKPSYPKLTTNSRGGQDNLATNGFAMSDGEGIYMIMIPEETERTNSVIPIPQSGKMKVTWFNPFTGAYLEKGIVNWTGWYELISPWQYSMSVVILEEVKS